MKININNTRPTLPLATREPGDIFCKPDALDVFYIVIRPDFELDECAGVYCVELIDGDLYCFPGSREIIPVTIEGTATF